METFKKNFQTYYDMHHPEKSSALRKNMLSAAYKTFNYLETDQSKDKLLDVACGTGELLKVSKDAGLVSVGIDISFEGLNIAREYNVENVILSDQEFLPFKSNSFEYITLVSALEYLADEEGVKRVLREVERVGKKDATIYIEVRNSDFILFKLLDFFLITKLFIKKIPTFKYKKDTIKVMRYKDLSYHQWAEIIEKSNFKIKKTWKAYKPLFSGDITYFIKTLIVNLLNVAMPTGLCYRIRYLCKIKN